MLHFCWQNIGKFQSCRHSSQHQRAVSHCLQVLQAMLFKGFLSRYRNWFVWSWKITLYSYVVACSMYIYIYHWYTTVRNCISNNGKQNWKTKTQKESKSTGSMILGRESIKYNLAAKRLLTALSGFNFGSKWQALRSITSKASLVGHKTRWQWTTMQRSWLFIGDDWISNMWSAV